MTPLQVTARLIGELALPNGPLALDALLASQVALRQGLPPPRHAADCEPIDIPVQLEPAGRFHLCSFSVFEPERYALRYVNRRAPLEQYQTIGNRKIRRVRINAGQNKSYRIPMETMHVIEDQLTWYCIGDPDAIRDLLSGVAAIGKKRGVGLGRVHEWVVASCEPWDGFPIVREGKPLRTLPLDWPGLVDPPQAFRTIQMPYWDHTREELCACPSSS